jgi:hypothetical protein
MSHEAYRYTFLQQLQKVTHSSKLIFVKFNHIPQMASQFMTRNAEITDLATHHLY